MPGTEDILIQSTNCGQDNYYMTPAGELYVETSEGTYPVDELPEGEECEAACVSPAESEMSCHYQDGTAVAEAREVATPSSGEPSRAAARFGEASGYTGGPEENQLVYQTDDGRVRYYQTPEGTFYVEDDIRGVTHPVDALPAEAGEAPYVPPAEDYSLHVCTDDPEILPRQFEANPEGTEVEQIMVSEAQLAVRAMSPEERAAFLERMLNGEPVNPLESLQDFIDQYGYVEGIQRFLAHLLGLDGEESLPDPAAEFRRQNGLDTATEMAEAGELDEPTQQVVERFIQSGESGGNGASSEQIEQAQAALTASEGGGSGNSGEEASGYAAGEGGSSGTPSGWNEGENFVPANVGNSGAEGTIAGDGATMAVASVAAGDDGTSDDANEGLASASLGLASTDAASDGGGLSIGPSFETASVTIFSSPDPSGLSPSELLSLWGASYGGFALTEPETPLPVVMIQGLGPLLVGTAETDRPGSIETSPVVSLAASTNGASLLVSGEGGSAVALVFAATELPAHGPGELTLVPPVSQGVSLVARGPQGRFGGSPFANGLLAFAFSGDESGDALRDPDFLSQSAAYSGLSSYAAGFHRLLVLPGGQLVASLNGSSKATPGYTIDGVLTRGNSADHREPGTDGGERGGSGEDRQQDDEYFAAAEREDEDELSFPSEDLAAGHA